MASLADAQRQTFEARLKRINKGGPNTAGTVIVGPQDDPKASKRRARKYQRPGNVFLSRLAAAFGHLFLLPVSFALGVFAMFAGIVGAFHFDRMELVDTTEASMLATISSQSALIFAFLLAIAFGWLFRLMNGPRKIGLVTGLAAAFLVQDMVIDSYPDVFARLMSDEITLDAAIAAFEPG